MRTHPFGVEASPGRLRVTGEVDMAVAAILLDAILCAALTGNDADLVVDLSEVTFLDSIGIAALVEAHTRLAGQRIELRITSPSLCVSQVFDVTGVGQVLAISA